MFFLVLDYLQKEKILMPNNTEQVNKDWDLTIEPQSSLFTLNFKDVWRYRDLLVLFVKRDFISFYKQYYQKQVLYSN